MAKPRSAAGDRRAKGGEEMNAVTIIAAALTVLAVHALRKL